MKIVAQVTMELRDIMRMKNFELFDFDYPIADVTWKNELEALFIDHYYFYEIGSETIDRFKHLLKARLNLIMPYYNELYMSKLMDIHPLLTQRIEETFEDNTTLQDNRTINVTGGYEDNFTNTDYPQTSNIETDIPSGRSKNTNSSNSKSTFGGGQTTTKDYSKVIEGFTGNQNELLKSYRDNIININKMVIDELKTLFILVY